MIGFGLLLAVIVLVAKGPPVDRENRGRLVFTEADLAHVRAAFERTWSRPPTAVELRNAFDRYVRDEVFYREALARELDRDDPVVKMSLVRKITMLATAALRTAEPTDEEIEAYYELRTERYRIPASFDLMQVCLSTDKHGKRIGTDAEELLAHLRSEEPAPEELAAMSDVFMLPAMTKDISEDELARTFGTAFRDTVMSLATGRWEGPVESGYGLHLVKIIQRRESRIPEWTEIRDRVANDMQFEGRSAAEDQFYAEIRPRYHIVYSEGLGAALDVDDARRSASP